MSHGLIKPCGMCRSVLKGHSCTSKEVKNRQAPLKLERKIARIIKKLHDRPNGHRFITVWDLEEYFKNELKAVKK